MQEAPILYLAEVPLAKSPVINKNKNALQELNYEIQMEVCLHLFAKRPYLGLSI